MSFDARYYVVVLSVLLSQFGIIGAHTHFPFFCIRATSHHDVTYLMILMRVERAADVHDVTVHMMQTCDHIHYSLLLVSCLSLSLSPLKLLLSSGFRWFLTQNPELLSPETQPKSFFTELKSSETR